MKKSALTAVAFVLLAALAMAAPYTEAGGSIDSGGGTGSGGAGEVGQYPNGHACGNDTHCASGFCVDDYCCDSACSGACDACNVSGSLGTCTDANSLCLGTSDSCYCSAGSCIACTGSRVCSSYACIGRSTGPSGGGGISLGEVPSEPGINVTENVSSNCGNGIKDAGEECDDTAGTPTGYKCTSDCKLEKLSPTTPKCVDNGACTNEEKSIGNCKDCQEAEKPPPTPPPEQKTAKIAPTETPEYQMSLSLLAVAAGLFVLFAVLFLGGGKGLAGLFGGLASKIAGILNRGKRGSLRPARPR